MKKCLIGFLLSLLLIILFTGCNSDGRKQAAENDTNQQPAIKVVRDIKQEINDLDARIKWRNIIGDAPEIILEMEKKYGDTQQANDEAMKILQEHWLLPLKKATDDLMSAQINPELQTLKDKAIAYLTARYDRDKIFLELSYKQKKLHKLSLESNEAAEKAEITLKRADFDYRNEYSKLTTGKALEVLDVYDVGQIEAYNSSNVLIGVVKIEGNVKTLGNRWSSQKAIGKFIVVQVCVRNNQKDAITVDANSFYLIDEQEREFSHSVEGSTAMMMSEGNNRGFLTKLNPGMAFLLKIAFDVPPGMPA